MASGADGAADALTRRYAKLSPAGPPGQYRVTFTGINSGADYVRLSALLQGMSVVPGITPLRATPQGLEVDLELLTGLPGFPRMVDEDVLLDRTSSVLGRCGSVRVHPGGRRLLQRKTRNT